MARKKQDIILENVVIESVAAEGKAIARIDGTVLFVQFAVPGDIVDVKVTKKKKNYMEGFVLRMVVPSEHRLEPFCKHFGICGGCKWQPLPYEMQLQAKQQQVYDQLVRIGHLDVPEISPIVASDDTTYYRNKLESGTTYVGEQSTTFSNVTFTLNDIISTEFKSQLANEDGSGYHELTVPFFFTTGTISAAEGENLVLLACDEYTVDDPAGYALYYGDMYPAAPEGVPTYAEIAKEKGAVIRKVECIPNGILDENGNPAPYAQNPVKFTLEGPLELVGPDLATAEGGMTGTYLRSTGKKGTTRLTISSHGLESITLDFTV